MSREQLDSWQINALLAVSQRDPNREHLAHLVGRVHHIGEHSWATNGIRMLRVDGTHGKPSDEEPPNYMGVLAEWQAPKFRALVSRSQLDEFARCVATTSAICSECGSHEAEPWEDCDECDGDGNCLHCGSECPECDGEGGFGCPSHKLDRTTRENSEEQWGWVAAGVALDRWILWEALQALPGSEVTVAYRGNLDPIHFEGPGWLLVVMPVRVDDQKVEVRLLPESEAA